MFQEIKPILNKSIKRAGIDSQIEAVKVLEAFSGLVAKVLPAEMADRLKPLYLSGGVLTVASLSDEATQLLSRQQPEILQEINNQFGRQLVNKFRYLT